MKAFYIFLKSGVSMVVYSGKDLTTYPDLDESDHFSVKWKDVSMVVETIQNTINETEFNNEHHDICATNAISKHEVSQYINDQMEEKYPASQVHKLGQGPGQGLM